jgi:hypothetical protein
VDVFHPQECPAWTSSVWSWRILSVTWKIAGEPWSHWWWLCRSIAVCLSTNPSLIFRQCGQCGSRI